VRLFGFLLFAVFSFSHAAPEKAYPSRIVAKAAAASPLARAASEPRISYGFNGEERGIEKFLASNRNTGLLVLRGGSVLVERYQHGGGPAVRFDSMAMANTVVAMLMGVALNEGKIKSIDQKAEEFVPELKGHPWGETSLRHLLTMSSGIRFAERNDGKPDHATLERRTLGQEGKGGADTVEPFRANPRRLPAGTGFIFSSGESQTLALVLRAAVGQPLAEYLSEKIWQPMGAEADATWNVDAAGQEIGFLGISATLRDWGRFGLLLANDGALGGRQVLPAAWVRAATTASAPHLEYGKAAGQAGYGYQTWLVDREKRRFAMFGQRGQAVFIDPATKLVIVHTGSVAREEQFALFYGALNSL
jgi:CubicO group peptidase (beta-lactamase class C family)